MQAVWTSTLYHHHHLPIPRNDGVCGGLEAFPVKAHPEDVVSMGWPGGGSQLGNFLNAAIGAEESGQDVRYAGTLHICTRLLRGSMYSGWSWNDLVAMQLLANLAACSSDGSKISQDAKLLPEKYLHGMSAVRRTSSNLSFCSPANLLVLRSETTKERIWGSRTLETSGMGKISRRQTFEGDMGCSFWPLVKEE